MTSERLALYLRQKRALSEALLSPTPRVDQQPTAIPWDEYEARMAAHDLIEWREIQTRWRQHRAAWWLTLPVLMAMGWLAPPLAPLLLAAWLAEA